MTEGIDQMAGLLAGATFVDLSPTIESGMSRWVSHPPVIVDPTINHDHDKYYCQMLIMPEHSGSHVDAPAHIHREMMDATIDRMPVETLLAPASLLDLRPFDLQPGQQATVDILRTAAEALPQPIGPNEIILLNFGWYARYWSTDATWRYYGENSPGMDEEAVLWVAEHAPRAVGADTVAVDTGVKEGKPIPGAGHRSHWLPRGIYIMESLANLENVPPRFFFMAFPLRIARGSGSPIRAVAAVI